MVVAKGQRAETAEEVEDLSTVLVDVIHPLRALDLDLVEAQKLHEVKLAGVQMRLEQIGHPLDAQSLGIFHGEKIGFGDCPGCEFGCIHHGPCPFRIGLCHDGHGDLPYSAGTWLAPTAWPDFLARYSS